MIVYGKTSVNTGKKGGVIVKLQCLIEKRGLLKPTYIDVSIIYWIRC
jgi:hypothetical protein